jgi:hypothetical protein
VDKEIAQVDNAALADAEHAIVPTCGMLTRNQSGPGAKDSLCASPRSHRRTTYK